MVETVTILVGSLLSAAGASIPTVAVVQGALIAGLPTVIQAGVALGLGVLGQALMEKPEASAPQPQDGSVLLRQAIPPRRDAVGLVLLGGSYLCYEMSDGTSVDVIAIMDGRIDAVVEHRLNDYIVNLDTAGYVEVEDGRFGPEKVRIFVKEGLDTQSAFAEVVALLGAVDAWTEDHRGDGIAMVAMICEGVGASSFRKVYPDGLPTPLTLARCRRVWDPRETGQDRHDPDTWAWSANAALEILYFLTSPTGLGLDVDRWIMPAISEWITAADECDALVPTLAGGNRPHWQAHGSWDLEGDTPSDTLAQLMRACDATLVPHPDGSVGIRCGTYEDDDFVVPAKHIRQFQYEFGPKIENIVTVAQGQFTSPAHDYSKQDVDPFELDDLVEKYGAKPTDFDLTWVQDHGQARELLKREIVRRNAWATGTMVTDLWGFGAIGRRRITIDMPYIPVFGMCRVEVKLLNIDLTNLSATIGWAAIDFDRLLAWTPSEEGTPPADPDRGAGSALEAPAALDVDVLTVDRTPYLRASWDAYGRTDLSFEVQTRLSDVGGGVPGAWNTVVSPDDDETTRDSGRQWVDTPAVVDGKVYDTRVYAITPGGRYSDPSLTVTVTADPDVDPPTVPEAAVIEDLGGGVARVRIEAPNDPGFLILRIWRAASGDPFGAATDVSGQIRLTANGTKAFNDACGAGSFTWWVTAEYSPASQSSPSDDASATIA